MVVGTQSHETCHNVCIKQKKECSERYYQSADCYEAARVICKNPYVHVYVNTIPYCTIGGGCFINCDQWNYAEVAMSSGTCGANECHFGVDDSFRIVCPCVDPEPDGTDAEFAIQVSQRQKIGLSIFATTGFVILLWLLYYSCSLQVIQRLSKLYCFCEFP